MTSVLLHLSDKLKRASIAVMGAMCVLNGCGAGNAAVTAPSSGLQIVVQPENVTTPLGAGATFTVTAQSANATSYQWSRNSNPVPGATGSSYTVASASLADSGSVFSVTVSDGNATVTSQNATLTVGPRSPAAGDLRFQSVASTTAAAANGNGSSLILWYPIGLSYPGTLGTPLRLGAGQCVAGVPQDCGWLYTTFPVSGSQQTVSYLADVMENLDREITSIPPTRVITSLDIEPAEDVFAISTASGSAAGFDLKHQSVPLSALQSAVTSAASSGRVVTAVSFNDATGLVDWLSYGWSAAKGAAYQARVSTSPYDGLGQAAQSLAAEGFIITAFGGNGMDGYILIGTKVSGDTLPRELLVSPDGSTSTQGFALVGWAVNTISGSNASPPVWLYQR